MIAIISFFITFTTELFFGSREIAAVDPETKNIVSSIYGDRYVERVVRVCPPEDFFISVQRNGNTILFKKYTLGERKLKCVLEKRFPKYTAFWAHPHITCPSSDLSGYCYASAESVFHVSEVEQKFLFEVGEDEFVEAIKEISPGKFIVHVEHHKKDHTRMTTLYEVASSGVLRKVVFPFSMAFSLIGDGHLFCRYAKDDGKLHFAELDAESFLLRDISFLETESRVFFSYPEAVIEDGGALYVKESNAVFRITLDGRIEKLVSAGEDELIYYHAVVGDYLFFVKGSVEPLRKEPLCRFSLRTGETDKIFSVPPGRIFGFPESNLLLVNKP